MSNQPDAVEALGNLGLTEYEARCFVALSRLKQGTAKEVSQLSDVPRSRVYDTVDRLHQRGLVDVQQSDPRQYRAISKDDAFEKLESAFRANVEEADAALENVRSAEPQAERGMWSIADEEHVNDRLGTLLDDAEDHVHMLVADESAVPEEIVDRLVAATERGVNVVVEVGTDSLEERIRADVPDADVTLFESLRETNPVVSKWPGKLAMVDRQAILASGLENSDRPFEQQETAVWTNGHNHGFAAWTRELLDDRLADF
ncbi:Sugar-specific transcriptional regulator TrmB [Halopelagius inordinatus]|uniref:Sugar-specific transcriptional regulator TrmB n=1 Tax=Halopelagius inordinatus TaxID=553467 RepID=A0A1I2MY63_9EURY|nr:helix-turn-helix domain-containing protein [Halopelagius inordinatus]SFF95579.1 Sugar-specific transcriptional regulator TrmB [Halopelagius inordinatus]